jgi:hypothetical protein
MTNEEQYIRQQMGTKNPFRVPEGYFDQFATELMKQLPQEENCMPKARQIPLMQRLRPLLYVAACLLIGIISVSIYFSSSDAEDNAAQMANASEATDTYFDEATEYAMVDNTDIYACLMND